MTEVSSRSITMLEVEVFLHNGLFSCRPRARPVHAPLSQDSAHPATVHKRWPPGYMQSTTKFCRHRSDHARRCVTLFWRLCCFHTPSSFVSWLGAFSKPRRNSFGEPCQPRMWLVLEWRSVHVAGHVSRSLRRLMSSDKIRALFLHLFGRAIDLGIGWRVAGRRLTACCNTRVLPPGRR